MTGLALLTPPLCCDPDVHALYALAAEHAEVALRYATPDARHRVETATTPDDLTVAVRVVLFEREDYLRLLARTAQDRALRVAAEDAADALSSTHDSWRRIMEAVRLLAVTPTVHALATHAPAVAGAAHVDADGREVTP